MAPAVITEVLENKPLDTDAVSGATYSCNGLTRAIENALQVEEDTYTILEAKPRAEKHKKAHHQVQKFVESEEQYEELVEKYKELIYDSNGKKKNKVIKRSFQKRLYVIENSFCVLFGCQLSNI